MTVFITKKCLELRYFWLIYLFVGDLPSSNVKVGDCDSCEVENLVLHGTNSSLLFARSFSDAIS